MVGLLQISAIDGSKIGDDKEIINDIVVSYFIPFVSVLLLFYEIYLYLHKDWMWVVWINMRVEKT